MLTVWVLRKDLYTHKTKKKAHLAAQLRTEFINKCIQSHYNSIFSNPSSLLQLTGKSNLPVPKFSVAYRTTKRSFTGMWPYMNCKSLRLREALTAVSTCIRTLTGMRSFMDVLQRGWTFAVLKDHGELTNSATLCFTK